MSAKILASGALCLVFGIQAIFAQAIGCTGAAPSLIGYNDLAGYSVPAAYGLATPIANGFGCGSSGVASTGGGLFVTSVSPNAPVGISVVSNIGYEGILAAIGNLPFLGTTNFEGVVGTAGLGAVTYGCGSGDVGISAEGPIATGITVPGAIFPPGISPSAGALADALSIVPSYGSNALGLNNYNGYGSVNVNGAGCGCI